MKNRVLPLFTLRTKSHAEAVQELMLELKNTGTAGGFSNRIVGFEDWNLITVLARYKELEKKYLSRSREFLLI